MLRCFIKNDFKLQYVATPVDAMQMLILRRADHALLAEPAISIALRKTGSFPVKLIAPDLYRSINLQLLHEIYYGTFLCTV